MTGADAPGFLLSGSDRARVWSVVGASVKRLLEANRGLDVLRVSGPMTPPDAGGEVEMRGEHLVVEHLAAA